MNREIDWIPVEVSDGMFSNEYSVVLKNVQDKLSLYVDKSLVRKDKDGSTFLKVYIIIKDDNKRVGLLPSETFETSSRWVELV